MTILIADDSEFMRVLLKDIVLSAWPDATIVEASTGQEAIDNHASSRPDLLLLDIMMPDKTGLDVMRELGSGTPVIVISAADQEHIVQEATSLGARSFIAKPFDKQKVIETMQSVVGSAPTGQ